MYSGGLNMATYFQLVLIVLVIVSSIALYHFMSSLLDRTRKMEGDMDRYRSYKLLNQQAPSFTLPDAENLMFDLRSSIENNGVLLIFIDSHCPYCMPSLEKFMFISQEKASFINCAVIIKESGISYYRDLYNNAQGIRLLQADETLFKQYEIHEYPYFIYVNFRQQIVYASPDSEGAIRFILNEADTMQSSVPLIHP